MEISRARLGVVMAMACVCFGCKGAGQALRVVGVVAVAAVRVAAAAAAAAPHHEESDDPPPPPPPPSPAPAIEAEAAPMVSPHPKCVEMGVAPELPGDAVAVRTVSCGGRVMVQDAGTGRWREHR